MRPAAGPAADTSGPEARVADTGSAAWARRTRPHTYLETRAAPLQRPVPACTAQETRPRYGGPASRAAGTVAYRTSRPTPSGWTAWRTPCHGTGTPTARLE